VVHRKWFELIIHQALAQNFRLCTLSAAATGSATAETFISRDCGRSIVFFHPVSILFYFVAATASAFVFAAAPSLFRLRVCCNATHAALCKTRLRRPPLTSRRTAFTLTRIENDSGNRNSAPRLCIMRHCWRVAWEGGGEPMRGDGKRRRRKG
jgi:hypothetical protein